MHTPKANIAIATAQCRLASAATTAHRETDVGVFALARAGLLDVVRTSQIAHRTRTSNFTITSIASTFTAVRALAVARTRICPLQKMAHVGPKCSGSQRHTADESAAVMETVEDTVDPAVVELVCSADDVGDNVDMVSVAFIDEVDDSADVDILDMVPVTGVVDIVVAVVVVDASGIDAGAEQFPNPLQYHTGEHCKQRPPLLSGGQAHAHTGGLVR